MVVLRVAGRVAGRDDWWGWRVSQWAVATVAWSVICLAGCWVDWWDVEMAVVMAARKVVCLVVCLVASWVSYSAVTWVVVRVAWKADLKVVVKAVGSVGR